MATTVINKGGILEKGTYKVLFGTVNADSGGVTYASDDTSLVEVLESLDINSQVSKVKIGGGLVPRHDYTQKMGTATVRFHLPRGGSLFVGKEGLPVKLTYQVWNDLTVSAIAQEAAVVSIKYSGRNGDSVFEEVELDFNPHWLVEAVA